MYILNMQTAKIFINGRSQAVRIPKEFQFKGEEVFIQKVGDAVILVPKNKAWNTFLDGLNGFTEEFLREGKLDLPDSERELF